MKPPRSSETKTPWNRCLDYLARREHSTAELRQKLNQAGHDDNEIDDALARLLEAGLQSDQRFTAAFVRSRHGRGHGPRRIQLDLRQRGINQSLIDEELEQSGFDWAEAARQAHDKRFGAVPVENLRDKAKRFRFLSQRGFEHRHIEYAIDGDD